MSFKDSEAAGEKQEKAVDLSLNNNNDSYISSVGDSFESVNEAKSSKQVLEDKK